MREIENTSEFKTLSQQGKPIFLDFYADWCGPCQALLPIVEKLAPEYADSIEIRKINVDHHPELSAQFSVRSIPALFFIKNQQIVTHVNGAIPETELRNHLQALIKA